MKKHNELERRVAALFAAPAFRPMRERDVAEALRLKSHERAELSAVLRQLKEQGVAAPSRGGRWSPVAVESTAVVEGIFRVRANGTCWLIPDSPQVPLYKIQSDRTGSALNGDRIQVLPMPRSEVSSRMFGRGDSGGGDIRWAKVVKVLERKRRWIVGVLQLTPYYAYLVPRDPLVPSNVRLTDAVQAMQAHRGHLVAARLQEPAPGAELALTAAFMEDLGDPDDPQNDIPALLLDHGQTEAFAPSVLREARRIPAAKTGGGFFGAKDPANDRRDLRNEQIVTIDPEDAHDYDDAVSVATLPNGGWRLGVHIADVAAYVQPGSELDREALRRGNSAYLVDRVIRMLPEDLTVRVCSLQPGEDHLTHSVEMDYDAQGTLRKVQTFRSVIRSAACLNYEEVQAFFDGGAPGNIPAAIQPMLRQLRALAIRLRARRFAEGALDFALPEVHVLVDAKGIVTGFQKRGATESYHLIEECMLAANQAVAQKVFAAGVPGIYRIHEEPSAEQWTRMATELHSLGIAETPKCAGDLNDIARSVLGHPEQYMVTLTLLRNMKRAIYASECHPHFGLGFDRYSHFTSPIRRYPDLILHRVLEAVETHARRPAYNAGQIAELARHCSDTEREAAEMEAQSVQAKRIRYYAERLARGEVGPWPGVIISLNPKGLIVELRDSLQQGMLPYASLGKERYWVADDQCSARARSGSPYRLGQPVDVILTAVDERLKRIDFALPDDARSRPSPGTASRGKSSVHRRIARDTSGATDSDSSPGKTKSSRRGDNRRRGSHGRQR